MFGVVIFIHVLLSLFLIGVILLQGGRGGLGEALGGAAAQSLFGGGANTVMTKITAVSASLFMATCLSLAALSTAHGRSVIDQLPSVMPESLPPVSNAFPMPSAAPRPSAPSASSTPSPAPTAPAAPAPSSPTSPDTTPSK